MTSTEFKSRIKMIFLVLVVFGVMPYASAQHDCGCSDSQYSGCGNCGTYDCSGNCVNQGSSETGGGCGNCGTLRRDCSGGCSWGSWYCTGEGVCSPGSAQCSGDTPQSCSGACQWTNGAACSLSDQWTCSAATREYRDYSCSAGACAYSVTSSENCATKATTDSDSSSTAYQVAGIVQDYAACSAGTCPSTSYSDSCTSNTLTEYGASGASYVSSGFNCESYESVYCFNGRQYQNEWVCSGNPGICSDSADTLIGTNLDSDLMDSQCGDSLCDNANGVYDSTKTETESLCTDGLDNDCDGFIDCLDNDCNGRVFGSVEDADSNPVFDARVNAIRNLATIGSAQTDAQGRYSMSINCGDYSLSVDHPDYAVVTRPEVVVDPMTDTEQDFSGGSALQLAISCESDCTKAGDDIIHSSCREVNGCGFYDDIAAAACDSSQVGWIREYNSTHEVECAGGAPQPKSMAAATASCSSGTLVKTSTIVLLNGEPVRLVVVSCV